MPPTKWEYRDQQCPPPEKVRSAAHPVGHCSAGQPNCEPTKEEMSSSKKRALEPESPTYVVLVDGKRLFYCSAMYRLQEALKMVDGLVNEDWVKEIVAIELSDPRNIWFRSGVQKNPRLRTYCSADGVLAIGLRNTMDVYDQRSLESLFASRLPVGVSDPFDSGSKLRFLGAHEKDLEGAYDGVDVDLDRMVAQGKVCAIPDGNLEVKSHLKVYFPIPEGMPACLGLKELWHSEECKLPDMHDIRKALKEKEKGVLVKRSAKGGKARAR